MFKNEVASNETAEGGTRVVGRWNVSEEGKVIIRAQSFAGRSGD